MDPHAHSGLFKASPKLLVVPVKVYAAFVIDIKMEDQSRFPKLPQAEPATTSASGRQDIILMEWSTSTIFIDSGGLCSGSHIGLH